MAVVILASCGATRLRSSVAPRLSGEKPLLPGEVASYRAGEGARVRYQLEVSLRRLPSPGGTLPPLPEGEV